MPRQPLQRVEPVRTLGLESLTDVQAFRHALGKRMSLPRLRIALRIGELPEARTEKYERRINRLLAANGLPEMAFGGAVVLSLMLILPIRLAILPHGMNTALWIIQMLLGAVAGGTAGRQIAIRKAWKQLRRLFGKLERELSKPTSSSSTTL